MPDCLITSGIIADCEDLRRVGGVDKRFWIFNRNHVDKTVGTNGYTISAEGYITAIAFTTYGGLYKFESKQQSHSGGYEGVFQVGGNTFFQHNVTSKLLNTTPADNEVVEELAVADVVIILETNNQEFIMYGGRNGMRMTESPQNTGTEAASDTSTTMTFVGQEKELPKYILSTDYATTIALLQSYEL